MGVSLSTEIRQKNFERHSTAWSSTAVA